MPRLAADLNTAVDARWAAARFIALHKGDPGTTGGLEEAGGTYARVQATPPAAVGGSSTAPEVTLNGQGGSTYTHWSRWTAATGGTCVDTVAITPNETLGAAAPVKVTATLTETSS